MNQYLLKYILLLLIFQIISDSFRHLFVSVLVIIARTYLRRAYQQLLWGMF
eukprot:gene26553-33153_t